MLIFSSIFGMGRFCRHHNFLPSFNLYRPCIATAVTVVVNAVALRCNLTQGTFINVLDSFWSVIFIFITRTLQGDLRASALPWLLHTAHLIFLATKRWKVLMKSVRHIWQENKCSLKKKWWIGYDYLHFSLPKTITKSCPWVGKENWMGSLLISTDFMPE